MLNLRLFTLLLAGLLLVAGCSTGKRTVRTKPLKKSSADYVLSRLPALSPEWFEGKAQIAYDDGSFSVKTTASIRMRRDSLIWISVKKLGIELARVQITRDSVFVLNRLNNEYVAEDLSLVEREYNFPANLTMLQAIILGSPILFIPPANLQSEVKTPSYHLFGNDNRTDCHYWIDGGTYHLRKMDIEELRAQRTLHILLDDYRQVADNQNFSYLRSLEVNSRETGQVSIGIEFSKVEFNVPKSIRFEIPSRYTRME